MSQKEHLKEEQEFSFRSLFVPLTTFKAIHIIVIVGFIVYFNSLFNGFVWDDISYILNNPQVHSFNLASIFGENYFNVGGQYRPIASLYFSLLYGVFKDASFFYHFFSIGLHIINSILVFFLFKNFFSKFLSLFLSLLFLVHPMQVESATFVATSGGIFFFLFGLLALILSMKELISTKRAITIVVFLFLALLSKETGILFLMMTIIYSLLYKKRNAILISISSILIIIFYLVVRFGIGNIPIVPQSTINPIARLSLEERLLNIPEIVFYYLNTFFFPINLSIMQNWVITEINFHNFYMPLFINLLFISACGVTGAYLYKHYKKIFTVFAFFLVWFFIGMLLHIQIFPLNMTVADRWFYFPMVGLLGVIGVGVQEVMLKTERRKKFAIFCAVIILIIFSVRTIVRNADWYDGITLYTHDSRLLPNSDIETNLGGEYFRLGKYDKALEHYMIAERLFPNARTLFNIGYTYEKMANHRKAKEYYYKALKSKHFSRIPQKQVLIIYERLAWVLLMENDLKNANIIIKTGFDEYPDAGSLWYLQAIYEYRSGNQNAALEAAEKARILYPTPYTKSLYMKILNRQPISME